MKRLNLLLTTCVLWLSGCAHQPVSPCAGPFVPVNPIHEEVRHEAG
jgi:hypothetical protein